MKLRRILVLAAFAAAPLGFGTFAAAQGANFSPAEIPPATFTGAQYVDSRGCVYVRAGVDGNVTWVPRMSRERKVICGQTPTLKAAEMALEVAPVAKPAAKPAPSATAAAASSDTMAAPATTRPQARPVAQETAAAPVAKPAPVVRPAASARPPMRTVASIPAAAPKPAPRRVYAAPAPKPVVAAPVARSQIALRAAEPGEVRGTDRVLPRHVYEKRDTTVMPTPKGYRKVWKDDRLNPHRANQTLNGRAQMLLTWTNTVPRRLIDRSSGRDVTAKFPKLYYPFTSMAEQKTYLSTKGTTVRTPKAAPRTVLSTKSAPRKPAVAATRYVQVGVFAQKGNASAAAARLQKLGMPVKYGVFQRNGQTMRAVLIPVSGGQQTANALAAARRAGFHDAYLR